MRIGKIESNMFILCHQEEKKLIQTNSADSMTNTKCHLYIYSFINNRNGLKTEISGSFTICMFKKRSTKVNNIVRYEKKPHYRNISCIKTIL